MADLVKPFRGTHYNVAEGEDISELVCPPYDVISKKEQVLLKKKSPYNFSKVLLTTKGDYKKLNQTFLDWLEKGILVDDGKDSIYLYEQKFFISGKLYCRYGLLSLLQMDKKGVVFPHEHTLKKPKADRRKIIRALKTNLSPIFVIVPRKLKILHDLYARYSQRKPFFVFTDFNGIESRIWKISQEKEVREICQNISKNKLIIADGHHRFEVSLDYFYENRGKFRNLNYILAYFTDQQEGLVILPTHRVVEFKNGKEILEKLKEYFIIKEVDLNVLESELKNKKSFCFGLSVAGKVYYLCLKNNNFFKIKPINSVYKKLDTYLLHELIFPLCNIKNVNIGYTHELKEAYTLAKKGKASFILRSAVLKDVVAIANKGYRLPQKSTYFYPKVSCGVVVRRFNVENI